MKAVCSVTGLQSLSVDTKGGKLTATGDIDPVDVVKKLTKIIHTKIETVEAVKSDKKDGEKKDDEKKDPIAECWKLIQQSCPPHIHPYHVVEEYPN
ncbi:hypothetical protein RJ641_033810, partial [Dillenia turbinata]